jgi:predicted permease
MDALYLGGTMFLVGFLLTTYHVSELFDPKKRGVTHLAWAMIGVGLFQIGSNLAAGGLQDRLKA